MRSQEFREAAYNIRPTSNHQKNMVYIKNQVKAKNVHIGEFTYYDNNAKPGADFETDNIFYNVPGHGDLYIGKFCSIAYGVEFIMGAANHSTRSFSTYPFNMISHDWAKRLGMTREDMPEYKDTIIGNDVWIGRQARIMPGVRIGDGAIIASYSVVVKDVPPYHLAAGDPAVIKKARFDEDTVAFLERIKWWDFEPEKLEEAIHYLTMIDLETAREQLERIYEEDQKLKR